MANNSGYNPNAYVYSSGSPKYYAGVKQQAMKKPAAKPSVGAPTEKPAATTPKPGPAASNPYGVDPAVLPYIQPQMTYLDQVQAQNQAALEGLTKAIMSQIAGISGQVGQNYDQGIQQQQALAQAGSDSLAKANGNAGIQSILGSIGAPANQQQQIADNLGQVFNGGAAATFGLQGTLPVTRLIADKLAQQNFASELPGIQSVAATNALKNLLASSSNEKLKVLAQVPQIQSDLAKSKLAQQQAASTDFYRRANLGLAKRKEAYSEWLGQKKLGLAASNQSFTQWAKTQGLKFEGQRVAIAQQNANTSAAQAAVNSSALQSKNVNGHVFNFDKATGTYYVPGTDIPVNPNSFPKAAEVSQTALKSARQMAAGFYKGPDGNTIGLPGITSLLKQYNTAYGKKYTVKQVLGNADALAALGVSHIADPQEIYVAIARMGVPAKTAFNIVAGRNKGWGTADRRASYFPKADAAQGAAYSTSKYVTVSPTANRKGVPLQPSVLDFVGRVGQIAGRKLTIGTGSNHNEYVVGSNRVSAHWTGRAADIPASGATLTKLGQDALIAAGADPRWARQQTGGLFNIGGYQVIFNSMEGGNHFNHLHVGLQGGTV